MPVEHHQGLDYAEFLAVVMFGVGEMISGFSSVVNVSLWALDEYAHLICSGEVTARYRHAID
jgi:hypothetical protein